MSSIDIRCKRITKSLKASLFLDYGFLTNKLESLAVILTLAVVKL